MSIATDGNCASISILLLFMGLRKNNQNKILKGHLFELKKIKTL